MDSQTADVLDSLGGLVQNVTTSGLTIYGDVTGKAPAYLLPQTGAPGGAVAAPTVTSGFLSNPLVLLGIVVVVGIIFWK